MAMSSQITIPISMVISFVENMAFTFLKSVNIDGAQGVMLLLLGFVKSDCGTKHNANHQ